MGGILFARFTCRFRGFEDSDPVNIPVCVRYISVILAIFFSYADVSNCMNASAYDLEFYVVRHGQLLLVTL